jgi:hypothetical protein
VDEAHRHAPHLMPRLYVYVQALIVLFVVAGIVIAITKLA